MPYRVVSASDPATRYGSMVRALKALYNAPHQREYLAIACLLVCYLDAAAARGGKSTRDGYLAFLQNNFRELCKRLDPKGGNDLRAGAAVFLNHFRNGFVHTFFARTARYAIAEDREVGGAYVAEVLPPGRSAPVIAINIDRLYRDFIAFARRKAKGA